MRTLTLAAATALLLVASPVLAENGGATDRQSGGFSGSQNERSGGGSNLGSPWGLLDAIARHFGFGSDRAPQKFESSSRRGHDPFNNPKPGNGMTGGDAYY